MNIRLYRQIVMIRKKSLLCLAVIFMLSIIVHLYTATLQESQLNAARSEWNNRRNEEKLGKTILSKATIYQNGKLDIEKLRQRIYSKDQFAKFIAELYQTSARNNLDITSLTYKPELVKDENLYKYSIILTSSGSYINQKKFISDLSLVENLIHIDAISFSSQGKDAGNVQLQTRLSAYFKLEAK